MIPETFRAHGMEYDTRDFMFEALVRAHIGMEYDTLFKTFKDNPELVRWLWPDGVEDAVDEELNGFESPIRGPIIFDDGVEEDPPAIVNGRGLYGQPVGQPRVCPYCASLTTYPDMDKLVSHMKSKHSGLPQPVVHERSGGGVG